MGVFSVLLQQRSKLREMVMTANGTEIPSVSPRPLSGIHIPLSDAPGRTGELPSHPIARVCVPLGAAVTCVTWSNPLGTLVTYQDRQHGSRLVWRPRCYPSHFVLLCFRWSLGIILFSMLSGTLPVFFRYASWPTALVRLISFVVKGHCLVRMCPPVKYHFAPFHFSWSLGIILISMSSVSLPMFLIYTSGTPEPEPFRSVLF